MLIKIKYVPFIALFLLCGCVKKKIYKSELLLRQQYQARESVFNKELAYRKKEVAKLTDTIGVLCRIIGSQEENIKNLNFEVNAKSAQFGESAGRLAQEKAQLESELDATKSTLAARESTINRIYALLSRRKEILAEQYDPLTEAYNAWLSAGATLVYTDESLILTLPDVHLFEPNGLNISGNGHAILMPLAQYLTERPDIDIDIVCHTDNTLPKDKAIRDTWDWSIQRATNICRVLLREFNVNANQLTPIGKGEFYPLTSNETGQGRAENRRTEIFVRPKLPVIKDE